MERFYQDLSQAVKQVPKRDMLLIMGDFNAKVGRREPADFGVEVAHYEQHVPLGDLFNCLRQVLVV